MPTQVSEQVEKFVDQIKREHLIQADPSVVSRVLALTADTFDPHYVAPPEVTKVLSRRELGLVPDGAVSVGLKGETVYHGEAAKYAPQPDVAPDVA